MVAPKSSGGSDADFVITRVLDAPRQLVFAAWTDPRHMTQWWGPKHFTCPTCEMDVRPGGTFCLVMRGPDGNDYPAKGVYGEIVPPERLEMTMDHSEMSDEWHDAVNPHRDKSLGKPAYQAAMTITFEDLGHDQTRLTIRSRFDSAEIRDMFVNLGMNEGWSQSLDKLAGAVEPDTSDREMVISRLIDAPRELVWDAWTNPEKVVHWWGPNGFTTTIHEMDVRPGGVWRHTMHGPDGTDYPNKSVFIEVVRPLRIVSAHSGNTEGKAGVSFISTWTFEAQGDKTLVTLRNVLPSAEEFRRVDREFGAVEGGKQTLGRLAEYVAKG